jgi:glycosyltransferase involved in cell wall biosynthesis
MVAWVVSKDLSIVLPFYRKLYEFERVLPFNEKFFGRRNYEVIVVADDGEEKGLLQLFSKYPHIDFRLIVNDKRHDWRAPSVAINVGIRHSSADKVLVTSPESIYCNDVPEILITKTNPTTFAVGKFGGLHLNPGEDIKIPALTHQYAHYGSICFAKESAERIHGYDESRKRWGGDDDDFRARLELSGVECVWTDAMILHVDWKDRSINKVGEKEFDIKEHSHSPIKAVSLRAPKKSVVNGDRWGLEFHRVAFDYRRLRS